MNAFWREKVLNKKGNPKAAFSIIYFGFKGS
jgi:hypothetical protein